jgi:hypothetical protein
MPWQVQSRIRSNRVPKGLPGSDCSTFTFTSLSQYPPAWENMGVCSPRGLCWIVMVARSQHQHVAIILLTLSNWRCKCAAAHAWKWHFWHKTARFPARWGTMWKYLILDLF